MLDSDDASCRLCLTDVVSLLQCDIELPPDWNDFFDQSGMLCATSDDQRRFRRQEMRVFAALEYRQTAPALYRRPGWHRVYLKDIAHGGLSFVHSEQLFPLERMRMLLPDERFSKILPERVECIVEIIRCVRIEDRCYVVGTCFVDDCHLRL
jgi:hypothetical protein